MTVTDSRRHDRCRRTRAGVRREVGRCTATLIRILGDIDLAQDAVAEAFAVAAERWPVDRACRRTRARGSPRPPATGPSIACAVNPPVPIRYIAAHRLAETDMTDDASNQNATDDRDGRDLDEFADVIPDDQLRLDVPLLPPGPVARCPGGAHPSPARRPRHRPRSPAPSSSPSRPSPSGSCGPSASCATTTPRTASPRRPSSPIDSASCSRRSR